MDSGFVVLGNNITGQLINVTVTNNTVENYMDKYVASYGQWYIDLNNVTVN